MKQLKATELKEGMVVAFWFDKKAKVLSVRRNPRYVSYRTEFGKSVAALDEELTIESDD